MTDATAPAAEPSGLRAKKMSLMEQDDRTKRRNAAEKRFQFYGLTAITVGVLALLMLMISILSNGLSAFSQTFVTFEVTLTPEQIAEAEASVEKTSKY